jgi:cephalosporin-C deacetylase-like acetyl esterase
VLENSSEIVGAAAVVDEEVLVSVGLVGESSPQPTHRTRAAINAVNTCKRIMFF